jgi:hypothetical protein
MLLYVQTWLPLLMVTLTAAIFFGPTFSMWFLFSNESAFVFNLNVMFPEVVFQPSLGYAMGI